MLQMFDGGQGIMTMSKRLVGFLLVASVVFLGACGGGSSSGVRMTPPPPTPTTPPPTTPTTPTTPPPTTPTTPTPPPAPDPTSEEIDAELQELIEQANSNISIFGGPVLTCQALSCRKPSTIYVQDSPSADVSTSGFEFTESRQGVSLAKKEIQAPQTETESVSYQFLGGWMEHNFFHIEVREERVSSGATFTYYDIISVGNATGTNPAAPAIGSATWSGAMAGLFVERTIPDADGDRDTAFVVGDASITLSSVAAGTDPTVDVLFSNIVHVDTGASLAGISWDTVAMTDGAFGSPSVIAPIVASDIDITGKGISDGVYGRFYGTGHEEVGGVFRHDLTGTGDAFIVGDVIVGVFGAKREE